MFKVIERNIFYADEWDYNAETDTYESTISGEILTAEEFEIKLIVG